MGRSKFFGLAVLTVGACLSGPNAANAQVAPPPAYTQPSAGMMANPYMNPYLNPYLNPVAAQLNPYGSAVAQQRLTPGMAGLYMYQANIASGGIGSGRISGTRSPVGTRQKAAVLPDSSAVPGSGAARFFNPGPVAAKGAGKYFNRGNSYFMNNRR